MSRYIDADKLLDRIHNPYEMAAVARWVNEAPTADARENVRGYWIGKPLAGYSKIRCSACRCVFMNATGKWKYCPECGAKMEEE